MRKHSIDKLAVMDERELKSLFFSIKAMTDRKRDRRQHVEKLEEELCYIQRELEIRRHRAQAHKDYLETLNKARSYRRARRV